MSIKYIERAWKMPLNATETIVLLALADSANDDGYCYPGYESLMSKAKVSRATLAKTISILEGAGFFVKKSHAEIGEGRKVNTYFLEFDDSWFEIKPDPKTKKDKLALKKSIELKLIEKINELREEKKQTISSGLKLRKVQSLNSKSLGPEHEPSLITVSKEPSDNVPPSSEEVTTPKKAKAKKDPKEPTQSQIDAEKVANYFAKKITDYNPKAVINPKSWIKDIELAIRKDGIDPKELCEVIQWIYTEGTFWIPNVLCGKTLREKYTKLSMQKMANKTNVSPITQPKRHFMEGAHFAKII
jgi:hypothetical protein